MVAKSSGQQKKDNKAFANSYINTYFEKRAEAKYNHDPMNELQRYLMMAFAAILMACGTHFFKYPNSFVIGGVEGISIIASTFIPLTRAVLTLIINLILLTIGFFVLGKHFTLRTGFVAILNSLTAIALDYIAPLNAALTDNKLLELIFTLLISAFGSAILFNLAASSGGTDIIAMIIKKYSSIEVGKALLCVDSIFTIASIWVFNVEIGLLSVLGLLLKGIIVDIIIQSMNTDKLFIIITTKPDQVGSYIRNELNRSATVIDGVGIYKGAERSVFLSALSPKESPRFKAYIKGVDPYSFITIINTSKIVGKGFYLTNDQD
ncbi:YitT family protein [Anaerococcus sp.]|uniref:YitT family protein n=1 Tax=Anaerococcus TaxID=165779 RepID=UPI002904261E|nr:YitT family protein [Anaerococcus sp.]MDU2353533.1 YitT family protein [Anaerococcus sp.]